MFRFVAMLLLCAAAYPAFSQGASAVPDNVRAETAIDRLRSIHSKEIAVGIPMPPKKLVGDGYLDAKWQNGSLLLYGVEKMVEGYPVRFDLMNNEMEIMTKSGVKVIDGKKIKTFVWMDSISSTLEYYVNGRDFMNSENVPFDGFFHILSDGKMPLMKHTEAVIKKATYTVQFDVGSKDDEIIKKEKLYYRSADQHVLPLPGSRKKIMALFGDKKGELEKYAETNRLSTADESHMARMFAYYNSLN